MGSTQPFTGTGNHPTNHLTRISSTQYMFSLYRFLRLWVVVWNGYDGRIYITSSPHLGDGKFMPPRILVEKSTEEEKNW